MFYLLSPRMFLKRPKKVSAIEVKPAEDSLRIYGLREPRERYLQVIGRRPLLDLHEPLVL